MYKVANQIILLQALLQHCRSYGIGDVTEPIQRALTREFEAAVVESDRALHVICALDLLLS